MQDLRSEQAGVSRVSGQWCVNHSESKSMNRNPTSPGELYLKEPWDFAGSELLRIL